MLEQSPGAQRTLAMFLLSRPACQALFLLFVTAIGLLEVILKRAFGYCQVFCHVRHVFSTYVGKLRAGAESALAPHDGK